MIEFIPLGRIADVEWGNTSITKASYVESGYPAFSASGPDGYLTSYEEEGAGVVLSAIGARCGRCFWTEGRWTAIKNTITIRAKSPLDNSYLFQYLNRENIWPSEGGAHPFIGLAKARKVRVYWPAESLRRRIAEILSTWDSAIEQTERLIDAKQRRKKALMQQLLTGKKRFAEFEGEEWIHATLEEVADLRFSGVDKKSQDDERPVKLCNYMDVYSNDIITSRICFMSATATSREIANFALKRGDVLITKDSETADDIGASAVVGEDLENVLCGYHLALLRPRHHLIDSTFLAKLFAENGISHRLSTLANGVTRYGLTNAALRHLRISLPSLAEQRKIAAVLNTADEEVVQLKSQLAALRRQKQGLMQVLLTGKVRVKVECTPTEGTHDE